MKSYVIRDESHTSGAKDIGILLYYERADCFYIELYSEINEWEAPFMLASYVRRGCFSIDSEWSRHWVEVRVVPPDRQNLGMILRDNGMKSYDIHRLLVLNNGRCAQDDLFINRIKESDWPVEIKTRMQSKIREAVPLSDGRLWVLFRDGMTRFYDHGWLKSRLPWLPDKTKHTDSSTLGIDDMDRFFRLSVEPGGHGIEWERTSRIKAGELRQDGVQLPLTSDDLLEIMRSRMANTTEASVMLHCSRQYINELTAKGTLHPVRTEHNSRWFLRSELEELGADLGYTH